MQGPLPSETGEKTKKDMDLWPLKPWEAVVLVKLSDVEIPEEISKVFTVLEKVPEKIPEGKVLIGVGNRPCSKCEIVVSTRPLEGCRYLASEDVEAALKFVLAFFGSTFKEIETPYCFTWKDFLEALGKGGFLKRVIIKERWEELLEVEGIERASLICFAMNPKVDYLERALEVAKKIAKGRNGPYIAICTREVRSAFVVIPAEH